MPGFDKASTLRASLETSGQMSDFNIYKTTANAANSVAGAPLELFQAAGSPIAMSFPGTAGVAVPMDGSFPGAIPVGSDLGSLYKYLVDLQINSPYTAQTLCLCDCLLYYPNININATPTTLVNTATLPRYTDGRGVMGIVTTTTLLATAAPILNFRYTDSTNTTDRLGALTAASTTAPISQMWHYNNSPFIPLGDVPVNIKLASAACQGICSDASGNIWVCDGTASAGVWKIVPSTGLTTHYTAGFTGAQLRGICLGSDNNLWAADFTTGNGVWKIVPSTGVGTMYACTAAIGQGICSDGTNLWMADYATGGGVWKITTTGTPTQYAIATSKMNGICLGPDGRLWVGDTVSDRGVWKITTAGATTQYAITGATCFGICSDGTNLWVNDSAAKHGVWKVTTGGSATQYPFAFTAASTVKDGICYDGAGYIWSVDATSGTGIWRLKISNGEIKNYPVAGLTGYGVKIGSDGNVWIADNTSGNGVWVQNLTPASNGIKSVQSYYISTGTATGAATLMLVKPLMYLPLGGARVTQEKDFFLNFPSAPRILDGACLGMFIMSGPLNATGSIYTGRLRYGWN